MLLYSVTLASLETISNYLSGFVTAQQVEFYLLMQRDEVKKITILVFQEGKNGNKNRFSQLKIRSHNQLNQILKKQNQSPKILPKRKTGNLYLLVSSHPREKNMFQWRDLNFIFLFQMAYLSRFTLFLVDQLNICLLIKQML